MGLRPRFSQPRTFPNPLPASQYAYLLFMDDAERDRRSGGQWLRSVRAYLEFMAGTAWRRYADRFSPEYLWYLNGVRALNGFDIVASHPAATIAPSTIEDNELSLLSRLPRISIVEELMYSNPALTDRHLLSHLQIHKLARMLFEAQQSQLRVAA